MLLVLAVLAAASPARANGEYVLGPGDKVAISVYERPDLSGEFRVLPPGFVSLPFVGDLPVAGRTLTELKQAIVERLRDGARILDPRVSVDIAEARPIFVAGDVRQPGSYPYRMGMTVLHAISAAGGYRALDTEGFMMRLEIGRVREKLRQSREAIGLAIMRRARLLAERADAEDFEVPAEARQLMTPEKVAQTYESELMLLRQRNEAFSSQLNVLARQVAVFNEEIHALNGQIAAKAREAELVDEERKFVDSLQDRGLATRVRIVDVQRLAVQIEGEKRQLQAYLAKAKQEIARVEQARETLTDHRQVEITSYIKESDDAISNLRIAVDEARSFLAEAGDVLPVPGRPVAAAGDAEFTILRTGSDGATLIAAQGDTTILPGDLINVPKRMN